MAKGTNTEKASARSARPAADPGGPQLGGVASALTGTGTARSGSRRNLTHSPCTHPDGHCPHFSHTVSLRVSVEVCCHCEGTQKVFTPSPSCARAADDRERFLRDLESAGFDADVMGIVRDYAAWKERAS